MENTSPDLNGQPLSIFGDIVAGDASPASGGVASAAAREAVDFLKRFDEHGRHHLTAIHPDETRKRRILAKAFPPDAWDAIARWVDVHNEEYNCYFSANEPKPGAPDDKLSKDDIGAIRCLYTDNDPKEGVPFEEGRTEVAELALRMQRHVAPPTFTIDTGGGFQLLWKLDRKLDAKEFKDWAEDHGRGLAQMFSADSVQNLDRLLRLPGTTNIPTAGKIKKGRPRRKASLPFRSDRVYSPDEIDANVTAAPPPKHKDNAPLVAKALDEIEAEGVFVGLSFDDLPGELRNKFTAALESYSKLRQLWEGDKAALTGPDASGSGWRASLALRLAQADDFTAAEYAQLACAWPQVLESLEKEERREKLDRALARDWGRIAAPEIERRRPENWFDREAAQAVALEASGTPAVEAARSDTFKLLSIDDLLNMPAPRFVIDGHLPERSLGFLYGEPGSKKSFLALDWSLHIGFGIPNWHGHAINAKPNGAVLYIAGEAAAGLAVRVSAWMNHHQIPQAERSAGRFRLLPHAVNFMDAAEVEKLARTLRQNFPGAVSAIVIDTVSRAIPGADENFQKEMSLFVRTCDRFRDVFDCIVLGVHHANAAGRLRGSTVLLGAGDFVFRLEKTKNSNVGKLACEKMKEAPDAWSALYKFDTAHADSGLSSLVLARTGGGAEGDEVTPEVQAKILDAMRKAWGAGKPWGKTYQSRGRFAVRRMEQEFGLSDDVARGHLDLLERAGVIVEETVNLSSKMKGFRVVDELSETEPAEERKSVLD